MVLLTLYHLIADKIVLENRDKSYSELETVENDSSENNSSTNHPDIKLENVKLEIKQELCGSKDENISDFSPPEKRKTNLNDDSRDTSLITSTNQAQIPALAIAEGDNLSTYQ